MKEREINLIDLIVEILLKWRAIVVAMLIGGVLLGGFSYVNSVRTANAQKAQKAALEAQMKEQLQAQQKALEDAENSEEEWSDANKQWLEEQLTEKQILNVNTAIAYEKLYGEKLIYSKTSDFMKMDPYSVPTADVTFLIRSNTLERTYNIEKVYEDMLTNTSMYEYVQKSCGISAEIVELISLERSSYGDEQGHDTVRFRIIHSDEETCKAMAQALIAYAEEQETILIDSLGYHEIIVLSQSYNTLMNLTVLNNQKACETELIGLQTSAVNLKNAFVGEEWRYYNYLTQGKAIANPDAEMSDETVNADVEQEPVLDTITVSSPGVSVKYIILGMILFAFVYVFVIFMMYILNNKLRTNESLHELYDMPQLGAVSFAKEQKRFLDVVDKWILKLRYRNQREFTVEESVNLAMVAVKMAAKKQQTATVALMGCNICEQTSDVCSRLKAGLEAEGLTVKILSNVLYNADTMEELADAQGAVLVETVGSTLYEEIVKELELLNRQNITVLGGIVVE